MRDPETAEQQTVTTGPARSGLAPMWWLVALISLPELILNLSDRGIVGSLLWRSLAYQNGAFWPGLLQDWIPNYATQPATMFLSYGLLHVGPAHMIGNAAALIWLGSALCPASGGWRLLVLFFASAIGAAAIYGLIATGLHPMVGASGAIFGLAGAWLVQELRPDFAVMRRFDQTGLPAWKWLGQILLLLTLVNVVYWYLQDGQLAWEAHLGGAITGFAVALIIGERRQPSSGQGGGG